MAEHGKLPGEVAHEYTPEQAQMILAFMEVKTPGVLAAAEKTLRAEGMWPDDDQVAAPARGGEER